MTAIVNNNKLVAPSSSTSMSTSPSTRCVTVRNLLESRRKSLTSSEVAVGVAASTSTFPDSVSPVPDVVATQIMTNNVAPPNSVSAAAASVVNPPPRDVTALTQVRV